MITINQDQYFTENDMYTKKYLRFSYLKFNLIFL